MNFFKRIQMTEKTENVLQKLKEKFQQKNMENITQDNIQDIHQVKKKGDEWSYEKEPNGALIYRGGTAAPVCALCEAWRR